ncbi:uncharacterized protein LACBIDRAFT_297914 [Laccaria bicolor S238N-H82]|uniref:Predicted protein n=1 Tax=Laccaria bicolor (strain S238N-H82 / ATCC MYA-4686) TaxID=486041 RepID=B0DB71_LACBS|nr:uncharacterized protein LACBIDRAFT_297914 [Laccaria bicolor S238N-H82]EDR08340.1 predicted protein [Laccaria bicolor S238N-H82]|eukprot:XP_001881410.1 predicted protein [Laccaria bicolor S238N-H82]
MLNITQCTQQYATHLTLQHDYTMHLTLQHTELCSHHILAFKRPLCLCTRALFVKFKTKMR